MVDTQHFCLRWNNYQSSITSAFENLRDDEDFVDVTLACDGKSLKAHRVVLSACSPYFRELLKSTPCKHPVIVLQDVAFSDLHALVEFIYHGEVNVHQRSLSSFLKTAEVLRVSGLTQQADQTERDELSHVRALAARTNHLPTHDKLADEGFPRGGSPPTPATPTPTTVQQLLRRGQIRRNEMRSPDSHEDSTKRLRGLSPPLNNNDATPTDFSMVKNHLSAKVEGNGLHDDNSRITEENIKCEPLELTGGNGGTGPNNEDSSDSGAAASDRPPASASSNEHEHEPEHPSTPNFLPDSKLFTSTPGSYNFSMAALTTDHTPLSVKFPGLGHGLQTPDLAGTSQDREVAEEDGGWRSATSGTTCHAVNQRGERDDEDDDESNSRNQSPTVTATTTTTTTTSSATDTPSATSTTTTTTTPIATTTSTSNATATSTNCTAVPSSTHLERTNDHVSSGTDDDVHHHQELPIIDLLDDINDHMQIAFKSEPLSPKIDVVDELESCLLTNATNEDYNNAEGVVTINKREDAFVNNSYNRASSQERTFQHINRETFGLFADVRMQSPNDGITQNDGTTTIQPLTKLREIGRRRVENELKFPAQHRTGSGTFCTFCQKTFSRAWSLQRHLADTHFYVPQSLACDQCGRSYKSRNSLVSHKSQYHARKDRKDHESHCEVTY